jgi:hypothetical protein
MTSGPLGSANVPYCQPTARNPIQAPSPIRAALQGMAGTILWGMVRQQMLYSFTCGPALLMCIACAVTLVRIKRQSPTLLGAVALAVATGNAALAAGTVLYYEARPAPDLPPWKDPEILNLGLLFLSAPIAMALAVWAGLRGAPKWLAWTIGLGSVPLMVVGFFASVAV